MPRLPQTNRLREIFATVGAAVVLAVAGTAAAAETAPDEFRVGRGEYLQGCAACHGDAADGKGPIAGMFRKAVPDLTGLAARNDGTFPFLRVFQIIDGRSVIRAHGDPMPVFGGRFRAEAEAGGGLYGSETAARARVLELVVYLQSIQK